MFEYITLRQYSYFNTGGELVFGPPICDCNLTGGCYKCLKTYYAEEKFKLNKIFKWSK